MKLILLLSFLSGFAHAYVATPDVIYDEINGVKLGMDVFTPSNPGMWLRPALVFIHGGCFSMGSRKDIPEEMKQLADEGFTVFSLSYRLSPVAKYPAAMKDIQQAIRFIRKNSLTYKIDPLRMIVHGESAGGTLAAYLGLRPVTNREGKIDLLSFRVPYVSEWFGRMDFTASQSTGEDCAESFLGLKRGPETMDAFKQASPLSYIDDRSAEFFIIHGTSDQQVYPIHSAMIANKLWSVGKKAELYFNENQPHGFDRRLPWILTKNRILAFAGKANKAKAHSPYHEVKFTLHERTPVSGKFDLNLILGLGPKTTVLSKAGSDIFSSGSFTGSFGVISRSKKIDLKLESFTRQNETEFVDLESSGLKIAR
ncbi:MAG: alpha/beta hydrolase [Bdellovibrionota bacterium]